MNYIRSVSPFHNTLASVGEAGSLGNTGFGLLTGGSGGSGPLARPDTRPPVKGGYFPQTKRLVKNWYGGTKLVPIPAEERAAHRRNWENRNPSAFYNEGGWVDGLTTWWNQGGDNAAVKRNREYALYTSARNDGKTDLKFKDWQKQNAKALEKVDGKPVQAPKDTIKTMVEMAPVIGDAAAMKNAYDAAQEGDWGTVGLELGTTAVGWVPFAGPLAEAGIRGAKNADLAITAAKNLDPDYAKLFAREVIGEAGPAAKSVGASAKFGEFDPKLGKHLAEGNKPERVLGSPLPRFEPGMNEKQYRKLLGEYESAAQAIGADAARIADDVPEVTAPSSVWKEAQPAKWTGHYTKKHNPQDLVRWTRPDKAQWEKLYPNVPYPEADPLVFTTRPTHSPNVSQGYSAPLAEHGLDVNPQLMPTESVGAYAARTTPDKGPLAPAEWADLPIADEGTRSTRRKGQLATAKTMDIPHVNTRYKDMDELLATDTGIHTVPQPSARTVDNVSPATLESAIADYRSNMPKEKWKAKYGFGEKQWDNMKLYKRQGPIGGGKPKPKPTSKPAAPTGRPHNWDSMTGGERARWMAEQIRKKNQPKKKPRGPHGRRRR